MLLALVLSVVISFSLLYGKTFAQNERSFPLPCIPFGDSNGSGKSEKREECYENKKTFVIGYVTYRCIILLLRMRSAEARAFNR